MVTLCVWWNFECVLYFELVSDDHAVNVDLYAQQLQRVYNALKVCYPTLANERCILLQHENTPTHTVNVIKYKLQEVKGMEVLIQPT